MCGVFAGTTSKAFHISVYVFNERKYQICNKSVRRPACTDVLWIWRLLSIKILSIEEAKVLAKNPHITIVYMKVNIDSSNLTLTWYICVLPTVSVVAAINMHHRSWWLMTSVLVTAKWRTLRAPDGSSAVTPSFHLHSSITSVPGRSIGWKKCKSHCLTVLSLELSL